MQYNKVGKIEKIRVYPVKSCRGQYVESWPISKRGLLYDREFAIVNDAEQQCVSLKRDTRMRHIQASLDLERQKLCLSYVERDSVFDNGTTHEVIPEFPNLEVNIDADNELKLVSESDSFTTTVCRSK